MQSGPSSETPGTETPDEDVVRRVAAGDVNAFEILVERYRGFVFAIVGRHVPAAEVEALAHEVFVEAFRSLAGYRSEGAFSNWLAGVCVRTCAGFWRRRYRNREVPLSTLSENQGEWLENLLSSQAEADFAAAGRQAEAREILEWALSRLPAQERMVLELVHLEGRSVKETAELMDLSSANVKVRAFRARKKLKKLLGRESVPTSGKTGQKR